MKTLVITMLICLSIIVIIIGCGGNDGVSQPSSVLNPSTGTSSITITVKWPGNGVEGSFTASSGSNSITASMPQDVEKIEFEVWEKDNPEHSLGNAVAQREPGAAIAHATIGDLIPATKVIIRATAYDGNGQKVITEEKEFQLAVGENKPVISLGDYSFDVKPFKAEIGVNEETDITATLKVVNPPDSKPVTGKKINFELSNAPSDVVLEPSSTTVSDGDGNYTVKLKGGNTACTDIGIKAVLDGTDLEDTCYVSIGTPTYAVHGYVSKDHIVADGGRAIIYTYVHGAYAYDSPTPFPYWGKSSIEASLDPNLANVEVTYNITSGNGTLSKYTAITDEKGYCQTEFYPSSLGNSTITMECNANGVSCNGYVTVEAVKDVVIDQDFDGFADYGGHIYGILYQPDPNLALPLGFYVDPGAGFGRTIIIPAFKSVTCAAEDPPYAFGIRIKQKLMGPVSPGEFYTQIGIASTPIITIIPSGATDCNNNLMNGFNFNEWNTLSFKISKKKIEYYINEQFIKECSVPFEPKINDLIYITNKHNEPGVGLYACDSWIDVIKMSRLWGIPGYDDDDGYVFVPKVK